MNNPKFQLEIGRIYKFVPFPKKDGALIFFNSELGVVNDKLKDVTGTSAQFHHEIFTVVSNVIHPYFWRSNISLVGIVIDNKKHFFKMKNDNIILYDLGIVEVE